MNKLKGFFSRQSGQVAIITGLAAVVLIASAAIAVDIGRLFEERRSLQKAADLAVLAGVQELPSDPNSATSKVLEYLSRNHPDAQADSIVVSSTYMPNDTIELVDSNPETGLFFARIFGINSSAVRARAKAMVASPSAYSHGVMPFGIMAKDPSATSEFGYEFNVKVTLKQPSQQGESGNFQFVALNLDGTHEGANFIYDALANGGVPNPVYIGREYYTKTGINGIQVVNKLNEWINCEHTFSEVCAIGEDGLVSFNDVGEDPHCHRIIVCPIIVNPEYPEGDPLRYNWSEIEGSKRVLVVAFAYFFVENIGASGNKCFVEGRFIRIVDESALDYGAYNDISPVVYVLVE